LNGRFGVRCRGTENMVSFCLALAHSLTPLA
jgi:hypothetical protein